MLSGLNAGNQDVPPHGGNMRYLGFNAVRLERRKSGAFAGTDDVIGQLASMLSGLNAGNQVRAGGA